MEICVTADPHLLLETVELLFAYANNVPPEALTAAGPYCLPAEAVADMMEQVCGSISREDHWLQYYFAGYKLPGEARRETCIARNIVYNVIFVSTGSLSADFDRVRQLRQEQVRENMQFYCIDPYRLDAVDRTEEQPASLKKDLAAIRMNPAYRKMLVEVFSDFDAAVQRLQERITPLAEKLQQLFAPWVRQAEQLADRWRSSLAQPEGMEKILGRLNLQESMGINALVMQLRYLQPIGGQGSLNVQQMQINLHMGVAMTLERESVDSFTAMEFKALRLLGNEDCMRMLRAMLDRPMSSREMAQLLNIPLGTVCRDVSNMYDNGLLLIETVNGWRRYRTNMEALRTISKHLRELEKFQMF